MTANTIWGSNICIKVANRRPRKRMQKVYLIVTNPQFYTVKFSEKITTQVMRKAYCAAP